MDVRKGTISQMLRMIEGLGTVNARENRRLSQLQTQLPARDNDAPRPKLQIAIRQDAADIPNRLMQVLAAIVRTIAKPVWQLCGLGEAEWAAFRQNRSLPDEKMIWKLVFGLTDVRRRGADPLFLAAGEHSLALVEITADGDAPAVSPSDEKQVDALISGLDAVARKVAAGVKEAAMRTMEYDENTASTIGQEVLRQPENALMYFIYTHLPDDMRTNADIYTRCGISPDTWTQMKKNLRQAALPVLVRLTTGLRLTADEAREMMAIAWAQRSMFSGVMQGMWRSGVVEPADIDELLGYWFPSDKNMVLYGSEDVYDAISLAQSEMLDKLILRSRSKGKKTVPVTQASAATLKLFEGYDDDEDAPGR